MPLVVAAAAAVPPAITPAPASKPPSGASAASTLQIRKAPEGVWATGSSKKAKGTQSTLPHKLYGITGSESSLTLVLEHLAKRDKLQAVFRVSDFSVEVKVKRRLVLPRTTAPPKPSRAVAAPWQRRTAAWAASALPGGRAHAM
jgi:hypothetical protein